MKVYLKGLNACVQRRQKMAQYADYLKRNGHELVGSPAQAHKVLIWSCGFRQDVMDNSLAEIARMNDSGHEVVVCGCVPDINPEGLSACHYGEVIPWKQENEGMARMFGAHGSTLGDMPVVYGEEFICHDTDLYKSEHPEADVQFYDRFNKITISEGCPYECTYCSEKLMLPPFRSYPQKEIIKETQRLVRSTGNYTIALLGESLGDYGVDIGLSFPDLLRVLRDIDSRINFALINMNPFHVIHYIGQMDQMFGKGYFHHMNLPVQSASDRILKLMKRPYTLADLKLMFQLFASHAFTNFDTHVIVGFPGETEEDFTQTCQLILEYRPNHILLSRCMLNGRIPAASLPDQVEEDIIVERIARAEKLFIEAGLFCNSDGGIQMRQRFRKRMNPSAAKTKRDEDHD